MSDPLIEKEVYADRRSQVLHITSSCGRSLAYEGIKAGFCDNKFLEKPYLTAVLLRLATSEAIILIMHYIKVCDMVI